MRLLANDATLLDSRFRGNDANLSAQKKAPLTRGFS
jgi:hypothetical protein